MPRTSARSPSDHSVPETVLITGASSGIGWDLAKLFAKDGARLVLVARRKDKLSDLAKAIQEETDAPVPILYPMDLSESDAPRKLVERLRTDGVIVDVLVNNAGFGERGYFAEMPVERIAEMVRLNVLTLTELTRRLTPGMVERRRGGVLNVASVAAYQAGPHMAVYFATKAYVLSLTEALYAELQPLGVAVTCLAPGATKTEFATAAKMEDSPLFTGSTMTSAAVAQAGYDGFRAGRRLVVPGLINWITTFASRLLPRSVTRTAAKMLVPLPPPNIGSGDSPEPSPSSDDTGRTTPPSETASHAGAPPNTN